MDTSILFGEGAEAALQRGNIKLAEDVMFTPGQVKYQMRQREKRKKNLDRNVSAPLLGGAALLGGGAAAYGAGDLMHRSGDISFNQLQNYLNTIGGKDPSTPQSIWSKIKEFGNAFSSDQHTAFPTTGLSEELTKDLADNPSTLQSFVPNVKLKDINLTPDPKIPDAIASTFDASDSLRSLLGYTEAGHRLLADRPYKGMTGYDAVKWFRSPANNWFRQNVPGQEGMFRTFEDENKFVPSWDNTGPGQMHYKSFSTSPTRALRQFTFENKGSLDQVIEQLGDARKATALSLLGRQGLKPEDAFNAFSDTSAKTLGEFASPLTSKALDGNIKSIKDVGDFLKNTLAPITTSPLVRNKHEASARLVAAAIEKSIGSSDASLQNILKSNDPAAIASRDYRGDIAKALGVEGPEGMRKRVEAMLDKADASALASGSTDPRAQVDAVYAALKDDPMAHVLGMGPHRDIPYPLAATMYGGLQKATRLPGLIANKLMNLSPAVKGVGAGLGIAGLGLGTYGIMNWLKREKARKETTRAAARTPELH